MKVVDIANEIYLENAQPSDTSIPAIAFWIRSNIGKLNNLIYTNYSINQTNLEIVDSSGNEVDILAAAIIKTMYKVYRVELDIRGILAGIGVDSVLEARDQDFSVKKINKSELLKTMTAFKKDSLKELHDLVHNYRSYNGSPSQVAGDDTVVGYYAGITSQYVRSNVGGT
jgi:hypothetical protein